MIAKVLRSGSGFSGIIEYLYEGKLENRKAEDKRAEVILHSDNVRVPRDCQDLAGRARMKADFIEQAQSHRHHKTRGKELIGEHVLSFTQDDMRKLRTKEGMRQVAGEYIQLLGLDKTQYVTILHQDTDNPHLHLLFNRITNDRKKFNDSWEKKRAVGAGVALAQKYGLHLVGGLSKEAKEPRAKTMRAGMEDLKKLQAQQPVFSQARNLHHLEKLAAKQVLEIEKTGDRIKVGGTDYKLSDVEAMFQANRNAAAAKKKAAASKETETPAQSGEIKQEALRAQERQELFKSLGMGHFTAKAERMGINVQKESEHISFNGERYLTKDVEQQLAQNFERSIEARLEYARQLGANTDTETVRGATDRNIKPDQAELFEVHSLDHFSYRAEAMGIPVEIGEQYVNIDGQQFAKQDLEEIFDRNKNENLARRQEYGEEELFRAQSMEDFRNTAEQLAWPIAEDEKNVTVNGETYPKEELEEVFAANKQQFHESLREWEPLLREARSMEELETKAQEAGVECRVEGGDLPSVHLNGESYRLETIADILKENLQGPAQQQKNEVEVEIKPEMEDLFRAQSMAQFVDHCRSQGLVVERDESSVSIGGSRYDKKELEAVFDANIAENREAVRQGEPLLQGAQTMMELEQAARKAKVEFSVSNSDPDREVVRLNGNTYEKHDIDVILSDNARPEALTPAKDQMLDSPEQLLEGRGLNCENLEHLQRLAEKMGIEVKIEKDLIQTRETGEPGKFQLFDRRAVEDIFNQKQMIRLSEIRQQVPLLDKIQSYKEFEELAQKTGTGYEAVQRTEHELALRQGEESLRQGKSDLKEGREKAEAGQILRDEGTERAKLGQQTLDTAREGTRMGSLSKSVREAQRSVREGWEAAAAGHALMKQGESQAGHGLELIAEGKKAVTDAQAAIQKARQEPVEKLVEKKTESAGVPEKAPSLLERIREQAPLLAGAVREKIGRGAPEAPATAYRINKETKRIVVSGKEGPTTLQRKDLQEIFAQNRKNSLLAVYEKRRDSRILREARNMGEFRRIAERLEIKHEDKGRSIEMKGQEYRKSDLQQIFQLNAQNPSNQREEWFDHRAGQDQNKMNSEVKTTDEERNRKSGATPGMVSEQTQKARKSNEDRPKQKRRKNGKKIPDFRQKIEKQELYRRQGQKI